MSAQMSFQDGVKSQEQAEPKSVYWVVSQNSDTRQFASLLKRLPDIAQMLNDLSQSYTVWVPCDEAILHGQLCNLPLDDLRDLFRRLISPIDVPTSVLSHCPNVPLLEEPPHLNGRQVLRTRPVYVQDFGPTYSVNFSSYITQLDLAAANGVIHVLDSIPTTPSTLASLLELLPATSFCILQYALRSCDFRLDVLERDGHNGGTFFAPTNAAFAKHKLNKINLIDSLGIEGKTSCLKGHFCPNQTLSSTMLYRGDRSQNSRLYPSGAEIPFVKGTVTHSLHTADPSRIVDVEIVRMGGLIDMRCNSKARVLSMDHLASDGVVHIVDDLVNLESS